MWIAGRWVDARSGKTRALPSPIDGAVIGTVPAADREDVARRGRRRAGRVRPRPVAEVTARDRGTLLFKIARGASAARRRRSPSPTPATCGKPIVEAEFDVADAAHCFEYYGGLATKIHGETLDVPDNALSMVVREPVGVVGQIIPWNYPLLMAAWKLAPALAAGSTAVLKPAEQTPLTALMLGAS